MELFHIIRDGVPLPVPLSRPEVEARMAEGWEGPILQQGAGPPWKTLADYKFVRPVPVAVPAPPRYFYTWVNGAASPRMDEAQLVAALVAGYTGPVILEG